MKEIKRLKKSDSRKVRRYKRLFGLAVRDDATGEIVIYAREPQEVKGRAKFLAFLKCRPILFYLFIGVYTITVFPLMLFLYFLSEACIKIGDFGYWLNHKI